MFTTTVSAIESYDKADFPQFSALYDEDDQLHVGCVAYGQPETCDYGVPGSPVWTEIADIEIDSYEINGVDYSRKTLTAEFGQELADDLHEICADRAAEKEDWE